MSVSRQDTIFMDGNQNSDCGWPVVGGQNVPGMGNRELFRIFKVFCTLVRVRITIVGKLKMCAGHYE